MASNQIHSKDSDCDVNPETNACRQCGVDHSGAPCADCGAVAFHAPGCPAMQGATA